MKKQYIFLFLLIIGCCYSCKKYLDVRPKSQIKEEFIFEKEKGFMDALSGVYTLMARRELYGDNLTMSFLDVLAQRYRGERKTSPYYNAINYNYNSDDRGSNKALLPVKTTIRTIWLSSYSAIANANNILSNIEEKKSIFTGNNYNLIKGEALGLRAFLHFDLLRMYGPMISENPSAKAIPYRTLLSREAQPLLPANEVIRLIIDDLLAAEKLLEQDPIVSGAANDNYDFNVANRKFRMNYLAVQATLARVYQYNNQPNEAYAYAKKVIASGKYSFVTSQEVSEDGFCRDRTFRNEQLFALQINNMKKYTDDYFNVNPKTFEGIQLNNDNTVIEALFENSSTDYRRQYLWSSTEGKLISTKYLQLENRAGFCVWPKNVVPVMRVSEVYYIAAECSPDLNESADLINEVLSHRGLDPLIGINSKAALQEALTKEYQKEFFSEGQLFYYYKRNKFNKIPGSNVAANSSVYVLPVPEDELIFNN
ncbi:RagB/SusD family nutrient uptake outer membrane protein [Pedobacter gandavensis]|uniref:RagB/SusD family nutrient uptake outer membrane protein n=1 Tax=Pedobacter gandavensis TaxID=2679963 RepID=UPI0029300BD2|nr:RagB/SusD family nutrient uptake outer membrane protein [Pedobacter gandavensis]